MAWWILPPEEQPAEATWVTPPDPPKQKSEFRQTTQEVQGSLIEGAEIWVPSVAISNAVRVRMSSVAEWANGMVWFNPAETNHAANTTWAAYLIFSQSAGLDGTHYANDITMRVYGADQNGSSLGDETVDQDSHTRLTIVSGVPGETFNDDNAPYAQFGLSHRDGSATLRDSNVTFKLIADNQVELEGVTRARGLVQADTANVTFSNVVAASQSITFDSTFLAAPHVTVSNGENSANGMQCNWGTTVTSTTGATISGRRNADGAAMTDTITVHWIAVEGNA